jgi:hypothetical protein
VVLGDLVAHPARAGVQEQPHPVLLVHGQLDEVVPGPESAELQVPAALQAGVDPGVVRPQVSSATGTSERPTLGVDRSDRSYEGRQIVGELH